jgi:hypothetical protein
VAVEAKEQRLDAVASICLRLSDCAESVQAALLDAA